MVSSFLQNVELHATISNSFCIFSGFLHLKRKIIIFVCVHMVNHDSNFNIESRVQINTEQPKFFTDAGVSNTAFVTNSSFN